MYYIRASRGDRSAILNPWFDEHGMPVEGEDRKPLAFSREDKAEQTAETMRSQYPGTTYEVVEEV